MSGFIGALQFLTGLPPFSQGRTDLSKISGSLAFFPVVGLVLGGILAAINYGAGLVWPSSVVNALLVAALVVMTGALHLDGFMDTIDAVFAPRSREQRLRILRDVQVGTFAVVGLFSLLLLKYAFLGAIPDSVKYQVLILAPTLSRWAMVFAIIAFPYAREEGLGYPFKSRSSWSSFVIASLGAWVVSYGLLGWLGIGALLGALVITWLLALFFKARLGGLTGDTYGAINEVMELSVFVLLPLGWRFLGS